MTLFVQPTKARNKLIMQCMELVKLPYVYYLSFVASKLNMLYP